MGERLEGQDLASWKGAEEEEGKEQKEEEAGLGGREGEA
jgi:hypothetical protein